MRTTYSRLAIALGVFVQILPGIAASERGVEGPERAPQFVLPGSAASDTGLRCTRQVLTELGWRFALGHSARLETYAGEPCDRRDLADAHSRGDLDATLPAPGADSTQLATDLAALLHEPATHCAYAMQLGSAARRAADRLIANRDFRFFALQTGWIGFGLGGARRDGWESIRAFGRGFQPNAAPSRAIESFYTGTVRAECGVGRQIAQYASFYELFGATGFDRAFARDEIVVGTFNQLHTTRSVLLGSRAGEFTRDADARQTSRQGLQAFSGLPGFIEHVFDPSTLDDIANQAENFVVYRVSPDAAAALRRVGGFEYYNRRNRELWELSRTIDLSAQRIYERVLYERDPALRATIAPEKLRVIEQMDAILADPFYRGFEVYVHPRGVQPVGYHLARLIDRNPRTPYRIQLGFHNLHTTIYARWIAQRLADCEETTIPAANQR